MDAAKNELETLHGLNHVSNCVHIVASYDGAYQIRNKKSGGGFSPYCYASAIAVGTGKVVAYDVACNSCKQCTIYANKLRDNAITTEEHHLWYQSHEKNPCWRRKLSDRLLNAADLALQESDIYVKNGVEFQIDRLECLSHVCKRLKANLSKRQEAVLKETRISKSVYVKDLMKDKKLSKKEASKQLEAGYRGTLKRQSTPRESWTHSTSESLEIKHLSDAMCGQIASYYRLAVQRNKGDV
ncbi:hypothetical protein LOD99_870 [Oopsacas minuta]|uniref:Mutator-like transposase domain-containing protein n=1 Tax=Oopsacas minuta TaxID=111878 RepID=A0AAV7K154_9METZ|nr:hypothetical protein LOD99_870 [Oopsacas minuta]